MYSGYWDDYYDIKDPYKECIHIYWKVTKPGYCDASRKATQRAYKKIYNVSWKEAGKIPIKERISKLIENGYTVKRGVWNESKKCWKEEYKTVII